VKLSYCCEKALQQLAYAPDVCGCSRHIFLMLCIRPLVACIGFSHWLFILQRNLVISVH